MSVELRYAPDRWNKDSKRRKARNCYAYFLQDLRNSDGSNLDSFPHPGAWAALVKREHDKTLIVSKPYHCDALQRAIFADNSSIEPIGRFQTCAPGFYKGFAAIDPDKEDGDFHFYVENAKGVWSHKPGSLPVTLLDAKANPIRDPLTAARGRYTVACGYYCVPRNDYGETHSAAKPT